jgi:hypothetical protein
MNERIKELAEQAGFNLIQHGDHVIYDISTKDNMREFAELIVRECMTVCQTIDKEYDGEDVLATWCATEIGKHFGLDK